MELNHYCIKNTKEYNYTPSELCKMVQCKDCQRFMEVRENTERVLSETKEWLRS